MKTYRNVDHAVSSAVLVVLEYQQRQNGRANTAQGLLSH